MGTMPRSSFLLLAIATGGTTRCAAQSACSTGEELRLLPQLDASCTQLITADLGDGTLYVCETPRKSHRRLALPQAYTSLLILVIFVGSLPVLFRLPARRDLLGRPRCPPESGGGWSPKAQQ